jgi:hypothetical protein
MMIEPGSIDHLSQVISHTVAPSFLLGSVAGFISILLGRLNVVVDRIRELNSIPDSGHNSAHLKEDLPRQLRRAQLLHRAIFFAILSGVCTSFLIVVAFASAIVGINHVWMSAILFIVCLILLFISLALFAMEVNIGFHKLDHYESTVKTS